jgi:hypothetical protein
MHIMDIELIEFESHYLLKKPHQNPLGSFKDLSIQTAGSDFVYTKLI